MTTISTTSPMVPPDNAYFVGGGEMGALMRAIDWSHTPLGPVARWPQSLRSAVSICLGSRFPILLWWGPDLVMIYNDAYRPILGSTKHPQALGQIGRECWPEIWHIIGPMLEETVMGQGEATWSEDQLLLLDRNGYLEECYFTFSYSPIRAESGDVGGVFCAVTETTAQVLGERRLRTLRELAAQVAQTSTVEEACLHAAQTLTANSTDIPFALLYLASDDSEFAQLMGSAGFEGDTAVAPARISLQADPGSSAAWPLREVAQSGEKILIQDLQSRFDGLFPRSAEGSSPTQALVLPIPAATGQQPVGMLVVGLNPRRALDDEYQGFLNLLISHIGTAIANARAYEEERKRVEALAELNLAKTTFFSNVSHEFRTPLTLMLGPLEESLAEAQTERQRERLELLQRNALRLQKLVNTLLDFSRVEAGRLRPKYVATDLAALTIDLASLFRSAMEKANLRLLVDCPPLSEPILVDRDMWEKIVLNLLSNALKFTLSGEIEITLHDVGETVQLAVRDTGSGIPAHQIPHLFTRFHRVEGTPARTLEGSGIGLALVQELVNLQGGTITVSSRLQEGTTFIVTIPKNKSHLPPNQNSSAPGLSPAPSTLSTSPAATQYIEEALTWLQDSDALTISASELLPASADVFPSEVSSRLGATKRARVLLADDNADMRTYMRRLLEPLYQVEAVSNGLAALAALRRQPPDLILADVMMPQLDGFGLLREVRADVATRSLPVILLSARAGEEAKIEGLEAGADNYLVKPFHARELLAHVSAQLELARVRRQALEAVQASEQSLLDLTHSLESRVLERTQQVRSLVTQLTMSEQEERRRISQILHDDLQQQLYGVQFQLSELTYSLKHEEGATALNTIVEMGESLHHMIRITRSLSVDLSPPVLYNEGLAEAVRWLGSQMERQYHLVVTVQAGEKLPIPSEDLRVLLFQIVRELLFNVVKHAGVNAATVALSYQPPAPAAPQPETGHFRIVVSDCGVGFALDATNGGEQNSQGFMRIRQRLELIGGHLHIESTLGVGSQVTILCPL